MTGATVSAILALYSNRSIITYVSNRSIPAARHAGDHVAASSSSNVVYKKTTLLYNRSSCRPYHVSAFFDNHLLIGLPIAFPLAMVTGPHSLLTFQYSVPLDPSIITLNRSIRTLVVIDRFHRPSGESIVRGINWSHGTLVID